MQDIAYYTDITTDVKYFNLEAQTPLSEIF